MTIEMIDNNEIIKRKILTELSRLGNGTWRLWKVLFICMIPAIINGLHIYSYVILAQMPKNFTCVISELHENNINLDTIKMISTRNVTESCNIRNLDYNFVKTLNHSDEINSYLNAEPFSEIPCTRNNKNYYHFEDSYNSIVPEWSLICDREILRTNVQVGLSCGKLIGALLFGVISDKYGRKTAVIAASLIYMFFGPLAAFATDYWLYLIARICMGIAASGVYHSANTIITEYANRNYRSFMTIIFTMSYPIGMIIFAFIANFIHSWRYLQLAISIPAFFLIYHYFYLDESPRWLIAKGKLMQAHKIVFGEPIEVTEFSKYQKKTDAQIHNLEEYLPNDMDSSRETRNYKILEKLKLLTSELTNLYGPLKLRKRALVCHFSWFVSLLTYYVIALNGDNFSANPYLYITIIGVMEIPSYIIPTIMLRFFGRKFVTITLFFTAGTSLFIILAIPREYSMIAVIVAMLGRMCISAVVSVLILHTTELFPTHIRNSAIGTSSAMSHFGSLSAPYIVDFLGKQLWYMPTTICSICAIFAGLFVFTLPETRHLELRDTIEEELNSDVH